MTRIAVVAILAVTLAAASWVWLASRPPDRAEPTRVDVAPGTTVRALGSRLEEARVIRNARLFEIWLRASGNAGSIQAGSYDFPPGLALPAVVEMVVVGRTLLASVTIPEGLRLEQQAGVASRQLGIDSVAFVAAATDSLFTDSLGIDAPTLEGYLFPETYLVDPATDARELVR